MSPDGQYNGQLANLIGREGVVGYAQYTVLTDVILFHICARRFCCHLVGKTLRNLFYCDIA